MNPTCDFLVHAEGFRNKSFSLKIDKLVFGHLRVAHLAGVRKCDLAAGNASLGVGVGLSNA